MSAFWPHSEDHLISNHVLRRFLERCPSSAAAEYEGLILGLAAAEREDPLQSLHIVGDCRVVLSQLDGRARSRKLSKFQKRAQMIIDSLACSPTVELRPRASNEHADALARAAVDAARSLNAGIILGTARSGARRTAVRLLEESGRCGIPRDSELFDTLLELCREASDWTTLLSIYSEARTCAHLRGGSANARDLAITALEAIQGSKGSTVERGIARVDHQLGELRRQRDIAARKRSPLISSASPSEVLKASRSLGRQAHRIAAAAPWMQALEAEAGGVPAMEGRVIDDMALAHLRGLTRRLASATGFAIRY